MMRGRAGPRLVVWAASNPPGVERCRVYEGASGWVVEGDLVRRLRAGPAAISYAIEVDTFWRTRRVKVEEVLRGRRHSLAIETKRSNWYVQGRKDERLEGCVDVDLGASPVTNTIPIKRARPRVGSRLDLTAAWVRFPGLEVEPLSQSYERVGDKSYVYRSASGFSSEIEVDDFGLVMRYGRYWQAL